MMLGHELLIDQVAACGRERVQDPEGRLFIRRPSEDVASQRQRRDRDDGLARLRLLRVPESHRHGLGFGARVRLLERFRGYHHDLREASAVPAPPRREHADLGHAVR